MVLLYESNTTTEEFLIPPIAEKETGDIANEVDISLYVSEITTSDSNLLSVDRMNNQITGNCASDNIDSEMDRKIDYLGHPLSSELLNKIDNYGEAVKMNN